MSGRPEPERTELGFAVEPLAEENLDEVLQLLGRTFPGQTFDRRWFAWKHELHPAGRSPGWVARDDDGVLGIRLFLRWEFEGGAGESIAALRPCDTATAQRARGRGVFKTLTQHALAQVEPDVSLLFNTPNEQSRPGYLKMGFEVWAEVSQALRLVLPRPARLESGSGLFAETIQPRPGATRLSSQFLEWRFVRVPDRRYEVVTLANADAPHGLVYRVRPWRGQRLLLCGLTWGRPDLVRRTIAAAVARERALLVWEARDEWQGARPTSRSTVVTRYPLRASGQFDAALTLADIENVL